MVFDYDAVTLNYGVSLEVLTGFRESDDVPSPAPIAVKDDGDMPPELF